jgi:hypothetical protein
MKEPAALRWITAAAETMTATADGGTRQPGR